MLDEVCTSIYKAQLIAVSSQFVFPNKNYDIIKSSKYFQFPKQLGRCISMISMNEIILAFDTNFSICFSLSSTEEDSSNSLIKPKNREK